jgi:hypothetical protein
MAHWSAVEALADELMARRRIEGDEVEQIVSCRDDPRVKQTPGPPCPATSAVHPLASVSCTVRIAITIIVQNPPWRVRLSEQAT